jgi:hypothetical protein
MNSSPEAGHSTPSISCDSFEIALWEEGDKQSVQGFFLRGVSFKDCVSVEPSELETSLERGTEL